MRGHDGGLKLFTAENAEKGRGGHREELRARLRMAEGAGIRLARRWMGCVGNRLGSSIKDKKRGIMNFVNLLLRTIGFIPSLVSGIESMLTSKSGIEKKDAAMAFLQSAIGMTDAIASREIVQPEQFKNGISQIIDGVVMCMNASTWAKDKPAVPLAEAH